MTVKKNLQRYINGDDVRLRLLDGWLQYKNKFWFVASHTGLKIRLVRFDTDREITVDANSPDIDLRSPALGFVRTSSSWILCERLPVRKQKQVVHLSNVVFYILEATGNWTSTAVSLTNIHFLNMLEGRYPSFEEAVASQTFTAFDRHFAVSKEGLVYHDQYPIGKIVKDPVSGQPAVALDFATENSSYVMKLSNIGVPCV